MIPGVDGLELGDRRFKNCIDVVSPHLFPRSRVDFYFISQQKPHLWSDFSQKFGSFLNQRGDSCQSLPFLRAQFSAHAGDHKWAGGFQELAANNGRFVPVYPALFNDPWWAERPQFAEFIAIANTGVPVSYEAPPSTASDEVLASNAIPEALRTVLVDGVDPAAAVARAHQRIAAISERMAKQGG